MKSVIVFKTCEEKSQIPWILILGDESTLPSSYLFRKEQVLSGPERMADFLRRPLSQGSKGKSHTSFLVRNKVRAVSCWSGKLFVSDVFLQM